MKKDELKSASTKNRDAQKTTLSAVVKSLLYDRESLPETCNQDRCHWQEHPVTGSLAGSITDSMWTTRNQL